MKILGLTGSIGMGKTTVTRQFAEAGAATTNADAIVHQLLAEDEKVIAAIAGEFPQAMQNGQVDRQTLGGMAFGDDAAMKQLERILHPRVRAAEIAFVLKSQKQGKWLVVLDIPLLFETGADARCDATVVVTAPAETQYARVMAREGMTEEKFHRILARQMPDAEKRARADYIVETHHGLEHSAEAVRRLMEQLQEGQKDA